MSDKTAVITALATFCTSAAWAQSAAPAHPSAPIYQVTVVERTVKAVNYQYRSGPPRIDFKAPVLLPKADGEASVEPKPARPEIDAKFAPLDPATRFGP